MLRSAGWTLCATAATIAAGSFAERCKHHAYIVFAFCLTGLIYPVVVHCCWSRYAWLARLGYAARVARVCGRRRRAD